MSLIKIKGLMNSKTLIFLPVVVTLFFCFACNRQPTLSADAKKFDFKGKVVSVDKSLRLLSIAHEEIKDYMPAMTMSFKVKDTWVFEIVKPGNQIAAAYIVDGADSWLEEVVITDQSIDTANPATGTAVEPKVGDEVPNYRLVNQNDKPIRLHDYKGKTLLLTFIFTRCQDPNQCTLMSANFARLNQELQKQPALHDKTHLLSISFDPEYDTPKVLRSYGAAYTGKYSDEKFEHWEFASGSLDEVKGIAQFFGLGYYKDEQTGNQQMIHTLRTAVIGPDSKIVKLYRGNEWKPEDVIKDISP
jgi:protein SCO1/2